MVNAGNDTADAENDNTQHHSSEHVNRSSVSWHREQRELVVQVRLHVVAVSRLSESIGDEHESSFQPIDPLPHDHVLASAGEQLVHQWVAKRWAGTDGLEKGDAVHWV